MAARQWSAESIARLLKKPRRSPSGWKACCPAHDDKNPSLFIADGADGVAMVCYAGCTYASIVNALGAYGVELGAPTDREGIPTEHGSLGAYTSYWDYRDPSGRVVMRICRWDVGNRKELRPLTRTIEGWKWTAHAVPRPLFNLDQLVNEPERPVMVVEGEKAAAAAARMFPKVVVTTWPGGAQSVGHADWSQIEGRHVTLVPDCDKPGIQAMQWVAKALASKAASIRVVDPRAHVPDLPDGWDLADAENEARDVSDWFAEAEQPAPKPALPYVWADDFDIDLNADQLVEDLIFPGAFVLAYGESNTGKTFLVFDMGIAIAHGRPWFGRETKRGLVVYIAGEGFMGVALRKKAYDMRGLIEPGAPFAVVKRAVDFLTGPSDTTDLIALVKQLEAERGVPCALIVVDTLARAIPGGSDAEGADMGSFIANADAVRQATGAALIAIHHAGKDLSKGARGHSSLRAAVDTELLIEGQQDPRTCTNTKQRDLDRAQPFTFQLELQVIATTDKGKTVTSCVVKPAGMSSAPRNKLTTQQRLVLNGLRDALREQGELPNIDVISGTFSHVPDRVLPVPVWREFLRARDILVGTDEATKKAFNRAKETLQLQELIHIQDGYVWLRK